MDDNRSFNTSSYFDWVRCQKLIHVKTSFKKSKDSIFKTNFDIIFLSINYINKS